MWRLSGKRLDALLFLLGFAVLAVGVYWPFLFESKSLILDPRDVGGDIIHIYYPTLKIFLEDGVGFWLNTYGLGTNLAIELPGYKLDPFIFLSYLFLSDIEQTLLVAQLVKLLFIAILFRAIASLYVTDKYYATLGALIFAFCSYNVIWGQHFFYSTGSLYFLLYFFSIELFQRKQTWYLIVISSAVGSLLFFQFTAVVIFVPFFLFFKKYYYNHSWGLYFMQFLSISIYTGIGFLLMAVFTFPYVYGVLNGPRVGRNTFGVKELALQSTDYYVTLFGRFLSSDALGTASKYFGYGNYYAAPLVFSSVLILILLPLHRFLVDRRMKIALSVLVLIAILPLLFPFFTWTVNLFQVIYYRFAVVSIFFLVLSTMISADVLKVSRRKLFQSSMLAVLIVLSSAFLLHRYFLFNDGEWATNHLLGPFYFDKVTHIKSVVLRVLCFAFLYVLALFLYQKRVKFKYILFLVILAEIIFEYAPQWNRPWLNKGDAALLYQKEKVHEDVYILNDSIFDQEEFFRYETEGDPFFLSKNESLVSGAPKVRMYQSNPPRKVVDLYHRLGIIDSASWINVLPPSGERSFNQDLFDDLASVKYYVKDSLLIDEKPLKITDEGRCITLNADYKKFGSIISGFYSISDDTPLDTIVKYLQKGKAIINRKDSITAINPRIQLEAHEGYQHETFGSDFFEGTIWVDSLSSIYFSIPYDQGWTAYIDGKKTPIHPCNIAFFFINVDPGVHHIEIRYKQPLLFEGIIVSSISLTLFLVFVLYSWMKKMRLAKDIGGG